MRLHTTFKVFYAFTVFDCNWMVFYFFKDDFTKQKSTLVEKTKSREGRPWILSYLKKHGVNQVQRKV